jgi:hypothetical protein
MINQRWVGSGGWGEFLPEDADGNTIAESLVRSKLKAEDQRQVLAELADTKRDISTVLSKIDLTDKALSKASGNVQFAIDSVERDREHASRTLDLMFDAEPSKEKKQPLPQLAIAMLLKDPNLVALHTFVAYHGQLGFVRFDFFLDDTNHCGEDETACNDAAAIVLEEFISIPKVVVHRCTKAWWGVAKLASKIWDEVHGI